MNRYIIGIDIGGTSVKMGLFDRGRFPEFSAEASVLTRTEEGGRFILPDIAEALLELLRGQGIGIAQVDGIGVGVPGAVISGEEKDTTLVNRCVNLGWGVKDAAAELAGLTGIPRVEVLNDANAAALGEAFCGAGKAAGTGRESLKGITTVLVTIGTGIGGGIVRSGRVIRGAFGSAGEIGHMKTAPQHPFLAELRAAGADIEAFADFEYFASATGVIRLARAAAVLPDGGKLAALFEPEIMDSGTAGSSGVKVGAKDIFDAAKGGDPCALRLRGFYFDTFGVGLAAVAAVIDPDAFIIGGGVSGEGQYLLDGIREAYGKYVFHASKDTDFRLAVLGNKAGMIGAAAAVTEE